MTFTKGAQASTVILCASAVLKDCHSRVHGPDQDWELGFGEQVWTGGWTKLGQTMGGGNLGVNDLSSWEASGMWCGTSSLTSLLQGQPPSEGR